MCAVTIVDRFTSTTLQIIFFILLHIRQRRRRGGQRSRRGVSGSGTTVGGGGHVSVSRAVRLDSHVVQGHGLSKAHSCPEALYPGGQWSTVAESCRVIYAHSWVSVCQWGTGSSRRQWLGVCPRNIGCQWRTASREASLIVFNS